MHSMNTLLSHYQTKPEVVCPHLSRSNITSMNVFRPTLTQVHTYTQTDISSAMSVCTVHTGQVCVCVCEADIAPDKISQEIQSFF